MGCDLGAVRRLVEEPAQVDGPLLVAANLIEPREGSWSFSESLT